MLVAVLSMSSSDLVSDCVDESKKYLQHIISTCGAKLVERIAEDYGLSQDELLEKYNLKVTNGVAVERPKPSPSKPSTSFLSQSFIVLVVSSFSALYKCFSGLRLKFELW